VNILRRLMGPGVRIAGLQVATLGPDNRVIFKPVKIARDLGDSVEIASGLSSSDRIIDSPPDGIAAGGES
jgi:hypothetical protein